MAPRTGSSKPLLRQIVPRRSLIDSTSSYSPVLVILAAASLVTANFASSTDCGAQFHSPNLGLSFRRGDTINVAYTSNLSNPTLKCFCGRTTPPIATAPIQQKIGVHSTPFNGSEPILLEFASPDPCWFELHDDDVACGDRSHQFSVLSRSRDDTEPTVGSMSPTATTSLLPSSVVANRISKTSTGAASSSPSTSGDTGGGGLSDGAKIGLGVAVAGASIAAIAMFACLYLRRRNRSNGGVPSGRGRKKKREKLFGSSSRSDDRLQIQPVLDGYPGSNGYDPNESGSHLHSPVWSHSPSVSTTGGRHYWTDREELLAARMNTPSLTSFSPSPRNAASAPRPNSGSADPNSREGSVFAGSHTSPDVRPKPSGGPLIVSYGPNRIHPTPVIANSSPPQEGAVLTQVPDLPVLPVGPTQIGEIPLPPQSTPSPPQPVSRPPPERKFSWDAANDPASAILPLPPYASIPDFQAMEKGAIRTMEGPGERAELPPTKDGYYHFGEEIVEYELPAAARRDHGPQFPYQLYRNHPDGRGRELEEQKFLLSDVEMSKMRVVRKAAKPPPASTSSSTVRGPVESYEMSGGPSSVDRHPDRW